MTTSTWSWAAALVRQRCPHCHRGRVFDGLFSMHSACPQCGLPFRREEGFWLGAMYFSYAFAVVILLPLFFFFQWLFPNWPGLLTATVAVIPYIPLTPLIFRYSRVLWLFFEDYVEPRGLVQRRR
ncbi:MAG TPA: DUF983 domain-containing protein [Gemmataceae bacterium]